MVKNEALSEYINNIIDAILKKPGSDPKYIRELYEITASYKCSDCSGSNYNGKDYYQNSYGSNNVQITGSYGESGMVCVLF